MLQLLIVSVVAGVVSVGDLASPRPTGWVVDQANIISPADEAKLNALAEELHRKRGMEVAVVTVDDVRGTPKAFATSLFNRWGIGSADTNNGVLVLLVMKQRRLEIDTGKGAAAALPAAWLADMQTRVMVPKFKAKNFAGGLVAGVEEISHEIMNAPGESTSTAPASEYRSDGTVTTPPAEQPTPAPAPVHTYREPSSDSDDGLPMLPFALGGVGLLGAGGTALGLRIRRKNRTCGTCSPAQRMVALDEYADDEHLSAGERAEERVSSVDYEVLVCPSCHGMRTLRHNKWFSSYDRCPGCGFKTEQTTRETITAATYSHGGEDRITERCAHCSRHHSYTRRTPKLERPSSTSSSSSSSRSSSSSSRSSSGSGFGGGSSGGGGAGSSW